tara:strand:+ start:8713 stop:9060 length:348 start_codon:yes stop_codon:yes gene_type:complete
MNNVDVCLFITGIISLQIVVKILKRIIKQKRPSQKLNSDYGMPSTRAAVVLFIATYLFLTTKNLSKITKIFILMFALLSCYMKYYLKEHSLEQLIVGGLIGILTGFLFNKIRIII